jgi:Fe-S-cluster containining protein
MSHAPAESDGPQDSPGVEAGRFGESLRILYRDLDAEVALAGPTCELSGRCCRFLEYGHTLFLSAPESEYLIAHAPPPARPLDEGATCPWQDVQGRCTAREARPLGCRVYYCDPSYQETAQELSERYIARLKRLADSLGLAWGYAPLHRHLHAAVAAGRFPDASQIQKNDRASHITK